MERRLDVAVEVVLREADFRGVREVDIRYVLERVSIIHGSTAVRHLDVAPTFQRGGHHEQVGRAVAFVFVIQAGRLPLFHRNRQARFGDKLLQRLVETDQRATRGARKACAIMGQSGNDRDSLEPTRRGLRLSLQNSLGSGGR